MYSPGGWLLVAGNVLVCVQGVVLPASAPAVTPAPQPAEAVMQSLEQRQVPDAISIAEVLFTALPLSLRVVAATNIPAISSILWEDFLDNKKPQWFLDLPKDIQSYLVVEFGPETAWPTAPPSNAVSNSQATTTGTEQPAETGISESDVSTSIAASSSGLEGSSAISSSIASSSEVSSYSTSSLTYSTRSSSASHIPSSTAALDFDAPPLSNTGLSRSQKVGVGVGVPLALFGIAALLFGCCFFWRRRRRRNEGDTEPPPSPGFIPRFSFQDRSLSYDHYEHRAPLNTGYNYNHSSSFVENANWDDDDYEPAAIAAAHRRDTFPPAATSTPMAMHDPQPILAPLLHTHSSRKARGKRTSYTSLHSVAEVTEPGDEMAESPILGRRQSPPRTRPRQPSMPLVLEIPPVSHAATIKRKPLPKSPIASPAAELASQSLLRPTLTTAMPQHSGSSSSGIALSSNSNSNSSSTSGPIYKPDSPTSPASAHAPTNPFSNHYAYHYAHDPESSHDVYLDYEDGLYGGNRSLDRYPDPSPPPRRNSTLSTTEWPLRSMLGSVKRNKSPMWDRVYESP